VVFCNPKGTSACSNPCKSNKLKIHLQNDRELAEAVLSEDNLFLSALLEQREVKKQERETREQDAIRRLNANSFDAEAQV